MLAVRCHASAMLAAGVEEGGGLAGGADALKGPLQDF